MREFSGELDGESRPSLGAKDPSFDDLMLIATHQDHHGHDERRWRLLLATLATLAADLSLDDLLARIVEAAANLAGARHAAFGVPDPPGGRSLQTLVTHSARGLPGVGTEFPQGRGVLGILLDRKGRADGLPGGAVPAMRTGAHQSGPRPVLAVPVRVREHAFGALYLKDNLAGAGFTQVDEQVATALAAAAGVAIENALLHQEASRRERWLAAAVDLTTAILRPDADAAAPQILADRAQEISRADLVWVATGADPTKLRLQAVAGTTVSPATMACVDLSSSLERCVAATGRPLTVKDLGRHPRSADVARTLGTEPAERGVVVPLHLPDGQSGVVCLAWRRDVDPAAVLQDASLPSLLIDQASSALQVAEARRDRERLAVVEDRDRIARDLHDLVIQHLYAVGLELQSIAAGHDPQEMRQRLDHTVDDIDVTIRDIRRSIFELGSGHDDADPRRALGAVVERAARTMKLRPTLRFRGPVRALIDGDLLEDLVAVVTETLANTTRHAQAGLCAVEVSVVDGIAVRVTDDGKGMEAVGHESGLANLRRRAELRGGQLKVVSALGQGTSVVWRVPVQGPKRAPATPGASQLR
ncbi:GAF domain-containing protein [Nocardioides houyundeii]|uniref:sensor histidine kinase n=1 Tax=Nocardioides houyundeii TaxID=2045452 RepID=UPI000C78D2E9|nr:GAF domain-containing protein [Nocardioides houyundeii]